MLQVATICYTKLNLCLLAIEQRKFEGGDIFINPKEKIINPNAIGKSFLTVLEKKFGSLPFFFECLKECRVRKFLS